MTVVNQAGHGKRFDFATLTAPEAMQRSLAAAYAAQSRNWNSHTTATTTWSKLKIFARFLAQQERAPQDLDGLTVALLKRWRTRHISTATGRRLLTGIRSVLQQDPRLTRGPVAEELARRVPSGKPTAQSFREAERDQVLLAARHEFRSAVLRIRENTALLERWRAGEMSDRTAEWRLGEILDYIANTGDVPRTTLPGGQTTVTNWRLLGGTRTPQTWGRLFLTRSELTSLGVLLSDAFGWNLSVYTRMPAPTSTPSAGESTSTTYLVQVEKRRAGGGRWFSTENHTDSGADSAGRLLTQALEATSHGRALASQLMPGNDFLMTARTGQLGSRRHDYDRPEQVGPLVFGIPDDAVHRWVKKHKTNGSPFRRIRRTTVVREGQPLQHSRGTHESVYMLPDRHVQEASQSVIEEGVQEAVELARRAVFVGRLSDTAHEGHAETVTADCADASTSPWPSPDGGCAADFLLCLGCRNAHVHPGHHPRLVHLHQQLDSLRSVLPEPSWQERWHEHWARLNDLRSKVGPSSWTAAKTRISAADRALVGLLVQGDLTP